VQPARHRSPWYRRYERLCRPLRAGRGGALHFDLRYPAARFRRARPRRVFKAWAGCDPGFSAVAKQFIITVIEKPGAIRTAATATTTVRDREIGRWFRAGRWEMTAEALRAFPSAASSPRPRGLTARSCASSSKAAITAPCQTDLASLDGTEPLRHKRLKRRKPPLVAYVASVVHSNPPNAQRGGGFGLQKLMGRASQCLNGRASCRACRAPATRQAAVASEPWTLSASATALQTSRMPTLAPAIIERLATSRAGICGSGRHQRPLSRGRRSTTLQSLRTPASLCGSCEAAEREPTPNQKRRTPHAGLASGSAPNAFLHRKRSRWKH
jgi:hypothetical protein